VRKEREVKVLRLRKGARLLLLRAKELHRPSLLLPPMLKVHHQLKLRPHQPMVRRPKPVLAKHPLPATPPPLQPLQQQKEKPLPGMPLPLLLLRARLPLLPQKQLLLPPRPLPQWKEKLLPPR